MSLDLSLSRDLVLALLPELVLTGWGLLLLLVVAARHRTAADLRALIADLKQRVRERFGIDVEEEVQYVGNFLPQA